MSNKPILFSGPMVRALLAGAKTQTRRMLNPQPEVNSNGWWHVFNRSGGVAGVAEEDVGRCAVHYLPIQVGDRLWVRESWNWTFIKDLAPGETLGRTVDECCDANGGFACPVGDGIVYEATNAHEHPQYGKALWKPSIHLPRYASRITLTVTEVRVQRVQDISEADAEAEGVSDEFTDYELYGQSQPYRYGYSSLWDNINGPGSWDANPWVAAYTFTVAMGNIDQIGASHG